MPSHETHAREMSRLHPGEQRKGTGGVWSCCGQAGDEQREWSTGLQAPCAGDAGAHSTSPMGSGGISSDSTARGFAPLVINGNYSASYAVIQGKAPTKRAAARHLTYQKMPRVRKNWICIMTHISTQAFQKRKAFCLTTEEGTGCQAASPWAGAHLHSSPPFTAPFATRKQTTDK